MQKHPEDTEYRSIVIVRDGKATALVEFMPMGYLGMYGMLYELEAVTPEAYSKYGAPAEEYSTYTAAQILTEHRTSDEFGRL